MKTLYEITGKNAGIFVWDDDQRTIFSHNWSIHEKHFPALDPLGLMPLNFYTNFRLVSKKQVANLIEEIPESDYCLTPLDAINGLKGVSGTVYRFEVGDNAGFCNLLCWYD